MKSEDRYGIGALTRGLEILELFTSENPSLTLTEIVQISGLIKSTAFRTLSTLESMGYVERDPTTKRFRPGFKVLRLGFSALHNMEIREIARPHLERLAERVQETASLAVLDGMDVVYVDRTRNKAIVGVIVDIGSRLPAHCTALGKVLLADLPDEELHNRVARGTLKRYTSHTITDHHVLLRELPVIRKKGYAGDDEELAVGLRAAAAPIFDMTGNAVAAVNISGPVTTISRERLKGQIVPALMETAMQISLALGFKKRSGSGVGERNPDKP